MSHFDPQKYQQLGEILREGLSRWAVGLSAEPLASVLHHLECGEYEISFEDFLLSAIKQNVPCSAETADEQYQLGIDLNLHKESVFDPDIWTKALAYWQRPRHLAPAHP